MLLRRSKKHGPFKAGLGGFLTARRAYIAVRTVAVMAAVYWIGGAREFDAMAHELMGAMRVVSEQIEHHGMDTEPRQKSKGSLDGEDN